MKESGISLQAAHRRTFSRFLNEKGYGYFVARRKGLVSEKDRKLRLKYARKMKRELARNSEFFKDEVAFYLDGVSFVHKQNLLQATIGAKSRVWRKKWEGLKFTAKGSKDLAGGRPLHLIVGTLSTFVEDENENEIMTWHALGHWDENIVFGAKIES